MLEIRNKLCSGKIDKWAPRLRPESVKDHGKPIIVDGLQSCDWHNQKSLHLSPSWDIGGRLVHCPQMIVTNSLLGNVSADPQIHVDGGYFDGGRDEGIICSLSRVVVAGIQKHQMPLLFTGGKFSLIELDDVRIWGEGNSSCIDGRAGRIDTVIIRNCPGLSIVLQGPPGSIGRVFVFGGGVLVRENKLPAGYPGAEIIQL